MVTKLRPVDVLRRVLGECRGADAEPVRNLFTVLHEEQACATALVLACLEAANNTQMADWATRAFFLYGGEPRPAPRPAGVSSPPSHGTPYQYGMSV